MKATHAQLWCGAALLALAALGCGKSSRNGASGQPAAPGGEAGAGGVPGVSEPLACTSPQPGPSPLLRLNREQLSSTLRDLFSAAPAVADPLEDALRRLPASYEGEAAMAPSYITVESYHRVAHEVALALSRDLASLFAFIRCDPAEAGPDTCRDQFIARWLQLTARRPPAPDEVTEAQAVFTQGEELGGGEFASGVRALVEVVLQGPDFLYLIQQGQGAAEDGVVSLTSHETATRLAYLLTGSMPDATLLAAADEGAFTDAALEAQARRLLGSAPSRRAARQFMANLLRYESWSPVSDPRYPTYTPEIAALANQESGRFVEDVMFDGPGTFRALYAGRSTWLNGPLAQYYGIAGVSGDAFQKVDLNGLPRAGILTQSAFLAATSPGGRANPVARGVAVLRQVLCVELPPPPADVQILPPDGLPEGATYRQRLEHDTSNPGCADCHRDINPVGFAFENYDAVGLWRDLENGQLIDASGTLHKTDAQGPFVGAVELVERIAESQDAQACFASHWLTHAYGRALLPEDACARQDVETAFRDSDGHIIEMLVALAKTDQLRYRLASELAP